MPVLVVECTVIIFVGVGFVPVSCSKPIAINANTPGIVSITTVKIEYHMLKENIFLSDNFLITKQCL